MTWPAKTEEYSKVCAAMKELTKNLSKMWACVQHKVKPDRSSKMQTQSLVAELSSVHCAMTRFIVTRNCLITFGGSIHRFVFFVERWAELVPTNSSVSLLSFHRIPPVFIRLTFTKRLVLYNFLCFVPFSGDRRRWQLDVPLVNPQC